MIKTQWVALIAVAIIAIGGYFFPMLSTPFGSVQSSTDITTTNFTTISSANGISNGGIFTTAFRTTALTQATTTPCAIASPNATSSLTSMALFLSVSSTTASIVTFATSTTAFATTSLVMTQSVGANAQANLVWNGGANNSVVSPNTFVVVGMAGGTGTFTPSGVCEATFQILN